MIGQTSLSSLPRLRAYHSKRISSYDVTGGNDDAFDIAPGERIACWTGTPDAIGAA